MMMTNEKLIDFISRFTDHKIDESKIIKSGRNYFYVSSQLKELKDNIGKDMFSLGIFVGEEKNEFMPSPGAIDIISKLPGSEKRKIFINKKAEWLFLCGRNILEQSVIKNPNNLHEGIVLVQNESDENLGYGIFKQEGKDLIIKHILDKGAYLRMDEKGRGRRNRR